MRKNDDVNDHELNVMTKHHGNENIICFWKNIKKDESIEQFAVYKLDNTLNDVDCERMMSRCKWINSYLNERTCGTTKKAGLFAIWNYDILCQ